MIESTHPKKILVFCSDVPPVNRLATSGGGLRSWQIIQGLLEKGYNVIYSVPQDRYLFRSQNLPEILKENSWNQQNQDGIVNKFKPDAIIFVNPDTNYLQNKWEMPLIGDLHGPRLIEHKLLYAQKGPNVEAQIIKQAVQSYQKMDFFTCAGKRQQYYFAAWMLLGGFDLEDVQIHNMPVSLSPELPDHEINKDEPVIIYSGGFYPWQNAFKALKTVSEILQKKQKGILEIFGSHHNISAEYVAKIDKQLKELAQNSRVRIYGSVSRDILLEHYKKAWAAIDVMEKNLERELCFPTRSIEYMWAGVPIIHADFSEIADYVVTGNAGWVLKPGELQKLAELCEKLLDNPEKCAIAGKNAQMLVERYFTWDKTIEPLAKYVEHPVIRKKKNSKNTPLYFLSGQSEVATPQKKAPNRLDAMRSKLAERFKKA